MKYQSIIDQINAAVERFSVFLAKEHTIRPISKEDFGDPYLSWNLTEVEWKEASYPGHSSLGVYFLLGRSQDDPESFGVYVGKASQAEFGYRFRSHLGNSPTKHLKQYPMKDANGQTFMLEQVVIIVMDDKPFMAPSLEEYLIRELSKDGVHLLNVLGKS